MMGPVVLVVEDEKDLVATYERLLRRQGCSVTAAGTLHDGLAALDAGRFALVKPFSALALASLIQEVLAAPPA